MLAVFLLILYIVSITQKQRKRHKIKQIGQAGETEVASQLDKLPKPYVVWNDLMLLKGDNRTAQIDHIVLSPYGVFVIETKYRHGRVHGYLDAREWVQSIGSKTHRFENPVRQNAVHVRTVLEHVPFIHKKDVHSIVVFPDNTELDVQGNSSPDTLVVHAKQLMFAIRKFNHPVLSDQLMKRAKDAFNRGELHGRHVRKMHLKDVQSHHRS